MLIVAALSAALGCSPKGTPMDSAQLKSFGTRYTAAWCSQNAASVAIASGLTRKLRANQRSWTVEGSLRKSRDERELIPNLDANTYAGRTPSAA